ncbi:ribosome biogenesis GTPase Der [bacterium]|nr:ribosome biogenesis GTPase Der [bacterium]
MNPVVLIVGRPNVGKSTVFNRLAGRPASLIFDRPGVTRDLVEADIEIGSTPVKLMDSAGWPYPGEDRDLTAKVNALVERTLKTCDLILWVVDGTAGRTGAEDALAQRLKTHRRKTALLVNKLDTFGDPATAWADSEFAGLPWRWSLPITAKHGRGFGDLLSLLEREMGGRRSGTAEAGDAADAGILKLCILGRPNVGKSTLVNALLKQDRMVVSDRPGTTRDAIGVSFDYGGRPILLVDTPGVRRAERITDGLERTMSRIALQTAQSAHVGLLMLDISEVLAEQDLRLASHLWDRGVTVVAAANKWDLTADRTDAVARKLEDEFRERMHGARAVPFVLISAKTGHGIDRLMKTVFEVHEAAHRKIRTPELNRRLQEWNADLPMSLFRGKPGKLKYGVQVRSAPASFKIFVNDKKTFRQAAVRYLEKRLREAFNLRGVPIQIKFEQSPSRKK